MKSTALPRDFRDWLNRPSHIGPKPRKRIPRVSKKRQRENREYTAKRKEFLAAHPDCMAWGVIVTEAPLKTLVVPYPDGTPPRATEIHHAAKRGKNYLDESTWLAVCRWSHEWIESHKSAARKLGLLST